MELKASAIHYVVSLYIPSQERPDRVYIMTGTMFFLAASSEKSLPNLSLGTSSEKSLRNSSLATFSEKSWRNSSLGTCPRNRSLGKPASESAHYRSGTLFSVLHRPFFGLPCPDRIITLDSLSDFHAVFVPSCASLKCDLLYLWISYTLPHLFYDRAVLFWETGPSWLSRAAIELQPELFERRCLLSVQCLALKLEPL
jgi:hypothetical protein